MANREEDVSSKIGRLLWAVAGKLAERGVRPEIDHERNLVTGWYDAPTDDKEDNLHKQSIRSLVKREGGDDVKVHINSMGESGFTTEIRPAAGVRVESTPSINLTNGGIAGLDGLADELEAIARRLRETTSG